MLYSWKRIKLGAKKEECSNQNSIIISIKRHEIFVDFNVRDKQLPSYKFNFSSDSHVREFGRQKKSTRKSVAISEKHKRSENEFEQNDFPQVSKRKLNRFSVSASREFDL